MLDFILLSLFFLANLGSIIFLSILIVDYYRLNKDEQTFETEKHAKYHLKKSSADAKLPVK